MCADFDFNFEKFTYKGIEYAATAKGTVYGEAYRTIEGGYCSSIDWNKTNIEYEEVYIELIDGNDCCEVEEDNPEYKNLLYIVDNIANDKCEICWG